MGGELIPTREVAELIGRTPRHVLWLVEKGKLSPVEWLSGGGYKLLFHPVEVTLYVGISEPELRQRLAQIRKKGVKKILEGTEALVGLRCEVGGGYVDTLPTWVGFAQQFPSVPHVSVTAVDGVGVVRVPSVTPGSFSWVADGPGSANWAAFTTEP